MTEGETSRQARGDRFRSAMLTWFPMVIAVLSLVTSIFNGYLNNKFVTMIQGGLPRSEYMRTCRDTIDAYFQVKYRAAVAARIAAARSADAAAASQEDVEAGNAVARFGALATYLANLRDEHIRARYTDLYRLLDKLTQPGAKLPPQERQSLLAKADDIFAGLNADCTKSAAMMN